MSQDPFDPHYDGENDNAEFGDRDPTADDWVRLFRDAVTWYKHETLYSVRELAEVFGRDSDQRDVWIEAVRRARSEGIIDRDIAANMLHWIVDDSLDDDPLFEDDARLEEISGQIEEIHRAHHHERMTPWRGPIPPQLRVMLDASNARELELIAEILESEGESEVAKLMRDDPDEFARRNAVAERKIRRDFADERERWQPLDARWREMLALDVNPE
jgi:hypothetical protein